MIRLATAALVFGLLLGQLVSGWAQPSVSGFGGGTVGAALLGPDGTTANNTFGFSAAAFNGMHRTASNNALIFSTGSSGFDTLALFSSGSVQNAVLGNLGIFGFTSNTNPNSGNDTGISRTSAGVVAIGTGAQGSVAGTVSAAGFTAGGNAGQSVTTTVRAAGGAADCTLIFTGGIKTGGTC